MSATLPALERGLAHHRSGDLQRAEQLYREVLQASPADTRALYLLGSVCEAQGRLAEAAASYREALRLGPGLAQAHNSLGVVLVRQGELAAAVASFQQAVRLEPELAEGHNNLGNALKELGDLPAAAAAYRQALWLKPDFAEAHSNLGALLADQGHFAEAVACCREGVRLRPTFVAAHTNLGRAHQGLGQRDEAWASYQQALLLDPSSVEAHHNLGALLAENGKPEEAEVHLRQAARLRPDYAEAHLNLGNLFNDQRRFEEAAASCREAIRLRPGHAAAHASLGLALVGLDRLPEALASSRQAIALQPGNARAHNSLGLVLSELGDTEAALTSYERALELDSDYPAAHVNRSLVWLLRGDFERGWAEYEWRWRLKEVPPRRYPQPLWDGSALAGRTLLLHAEQGLGDTVQFARYAPLARARGGRVLLECQRPLLPLLASLPGVDGLLARGDPLPPFDVHAPLLSLPRLLGGPDTAPPPPYLHADPQRVEHWRRRLEHLGPCRVGIAWQGNARTYRRDRWRSVPLREFEPLAQVAGVTLVSLQKGAGVEQLREVSFPVADLGEELDASGAFVDTAAVMHGLDLVICSDSAVAHLAGALGVPVWLALGAVPDWRWLLGRDDCPWYPSMRLFRQTTRGDWTAVFQQLANQLRQRVPDRRGRTVRVEVAPGELIDRITILEIKSERITDAAKLANVRRELAALQAVRPRAVPSSAELTQLTAELRGVNETLWDVEDAIRLCDRAGDFGPRFIELARSVYRHNDHRAALKRKINDLLGARFREEKVYTAPGA